MPESPDRLTEVHSADSELLNIPSGKTLFSMDEFSSEDGFLEESGYLLGWNCIQGAISDIYASGGYPIFVGHSMVISNSWTEEYITQFSRGIADCIKQSKAQFAGGDLSFSDRWSYTATVLGKTFNKNLLRTGANVGDNIYITGRLGLGNIFYALNMYKAKPFVKRLIKIVNNKFPSRLEQSKIISNYATSSIDTSDGLLLGLDSLANNSGVGFKLYDIPVIKGAKTLSKIFKLPWELLYIAGAGEYELLFTAKPSDDESIYSEFSKKGLKLYHMGQVIKEKDPKFINLSKGNREFKDPKEYLNYLIKELKNV